jgi:hypothetical protein
MEKTLEQRKEKVARALAGEKDDLYLAPNGTKVARGMRRNSRDIPVNSGQAKPTMVLGFQETIRDSGDDIAQAVSV